VGEAFSETATTKSVRPPSTSFSEAGPESGVNTATDPAAAGQGNATRAIHRRTAAGTDVDGRSAADARAESTAVSTLV
jgi:hypothetical protein